MSITYCKGIAMFGMYCNVRVVGIHEIDVKDEDGGIKFDTLFNWTKYVE